MKFLYNLKIDKSKLSVDLDDFHIYLPLYL